MLYKLIDAVFGCHHARYSFPITVRPGSRSAMSQRPGTYVACLDCGKEFRYDWQEMKIIGSQEQRSLKQGPQTRETAHSFATKEAA
jgi:hypothetical protein